MDETAAAMMERALGFIEAARALGPSHPTTRAAAFESARHAAELACKALLQMATGAYAKREHNVGGMMGAAGVIPMDVDPGGLSDFVGGHTKARYGFEHTFTEGEVEDAIATAGRMLEAAFEWPNGRFHAPWPTGAED